MRLNHRGHTLTEIMVAMAIFTMIIAGMYGALYAGNVSWATQDVRADIQDQARRAMGRLSQDLRVAQALTINTVVSGDDTTIDVSFTRDGGNVTYDWTTAAGGTQNQLIRTDSAGAVITARDISALSFAESASDVKINLTVSAESNLHQAAEFSLVGNIARR